jgi:hypothetical protein
MGPQVQSRFLAELTFLGMISRNDMKQRRRQAQSRNIIRDAADANDGGWWFGKKHKTGGLGVPLSNCVSTCETL